MSNEFETVVGLEVHCELATRTKLFCSCPNRFGDEPNTNVCPVCLGLPGSLPVLNEAAVEMAMRIGLALHCEIRPSVFHRKNYFYPDMPKDYQISQYDAPICVNGWLELPDGSKVGIVRAHLEEDTGKTTHVGSTGRIHDASYSLVDYNRAGVPLVEVVSAPDISSGQQARQYVSELRAILLATATSDGKLEEGSLRVDANVSVRRKGSDELGTRCEIKNLNSLRSLARAIEYESERQADLIRQGLEVVQETRHWSEDEERTVPMRSKEEAFDYRYFPEPDLVALVPGEQWIERVRGSMGMLPEERRKRLIEAIVRPRSSSEPTTSHISQAESDAEKSSDETPAEAVLSHVAKVVELGLDDLVIAAIELGADRRIAVMRAVNEAAADPERARHIEAGHFAKLIEMEHKGRISATQAKTILARMLEGDGEDPETIAAKEGFSALSRDELVEVINSVISANSDAWQRFVSGDQAVGKFLVGQVMKATRGRADGRAVMELLTARNEG
ncbi:MAG: Asp-tRNA(Asn)/Glu-tRNA(Gln) amidotransferase subunit GatB [Actinobacteria bacterium]|nr:Asp-tRNA(Asn)/Glu-tRNA(Gln) amidotransferase subunit GatB [Actinomycetota bacterium]MCL6094997.1 Asp-tRNA(Asn)/Glu-tRNA(Gln) amidotransferase subunit GatB [Actinomycetota bacterium]